MAAVYFADTFWWIALSNPKDAWHARTIAWETAHPNARIVTTEEILSELLTWFAATGRAGRVLASATVRDILGDPGTQVLPQTSADFLAALALYEGRPDKEYSLTDCRSMLALRALGIKEVVDKRPSLHPGRFHDLVSVTLTESETAPWYSRRVRLRRRRPVPRLL